MYINKATQQPSFPTTQAFPPYTCNVNDEIDHEHNICDVYILVAAANNGNFGVKLKKT